MELASAGGEGPRELTALRRMLSAYQANGAQLGWLLISEQQAGEIWPACGHLFTGLRIALQEIRQG